MPNIYIEAYEDIAKGSAIDVEFEVYCSSCGAGLCHVTQVSVTRTRRMPRVVIAPCPDCIRQAASDGFDEGYESGSECEHSSVCLDTEND